MIGLFSKGPKELSKKQKSKKSLILLLQNYYHCSETKWIILFSRIFPFFRTIFIFFSNYEYVRSFKAAWTRICCLSCFLQPNFNPALLQIVPIIQKWREYFPLMQPLSSKDRNNLLNSLLDKIFNIHYNFIDWSKNYFCDIVKDDNSHAVAKIESRKSKIEKVFWNRDLH